MVSGPALFGLLAFALAGCIPEEEPIAPFDRGDAITSVIGMGSDYGTQVFFDLGEARVVAEKPVAGWDLGFRCDPEGYHILLNGGLIASVSDLGPVEFDHPVTGSEAKGLTYSYDRPSGEWDSTAFGEWWTGAEPSIESKRHLYIVDRGYSPAGKSLGYARVMILSATPSDYTVRTAALNNSNDHTITIPRDPERNLVGLSFDSDEPVEIEPRRDEWDLLFTRYTHIFYEPDFTPYSVTGILLNRFNTTAAVDSGGMFAGVTAAATDSIDFSSALDAIGYDWKTYDLNAGLFTVDSPVYLVRDSRGFIYKLHLLDFYNTSGEKGYPTMESQTL